MQPKIQIISNRDEQRLCVLRAELKDQGITDYEFSDAVFKANPIDGIAEAHFNAIEKGLSYSEYAVVFEDDIKFTSPRSYSHWVKCMEELPSDWDVYLIGYYYHHRMERYSENLNKLRDFSALHGYMINKKCLPFLKDRHQGKHIDRWMGHCGLNIYTVNPVCAIQQENVSLRLGRKVKYDRLIKKLTLLK
jgi:hypothetical protein